MKRLITVLLCVAMILALTPVLSAGAEEEYAAPVFYGAQVQAAEEGFVNLRFVSKVASTKGAKVGYEIVADFVSGGKGQGVTYSGATLESDTIYSQITAGGDTVTASSLGCEGLFGLIIKNVPTNLEIVFSVRTYLLDDTGSKLAEADKKMFVVENGAISDKVAVYSENFNTMTMDLACGQTGGTDPQTGATFDSTLGLSNKSAYQSAFKAVTGWTVGSASNNGTIGAKAVAADGKLTLSGGSAVDHYAILPAGTMDEYIAYTVECDISVAAMNGKMIIFAPHEKYNSPTAMGRSNEVRFRDYTSDARSSTGGSNGFLGMEYNLGATNAQKQTKSALGLTDKGFNQQFHLKITYDWTTNALTVSVTPVGGETLDLINATMTVGTDGGLFLGVQQAVFTIDNLRVIAVTEQLD